MATTYPQQPKTSTQESAAFRPRPAADSPRPAADSPRPAADSPRPAAQPSEQSRRVLTPAKELRVAFVSDAIDGRNGVGTYYPDLLKHLEPHVQALSLIAPQQSANDLEWFSLPMPGDSTQRMAWPNNRRLCKHLDELHPDLIVLPSLGAYSYFGMQYARRQKIPFAIVNHTDFDKLLELYWPAWCTSPFRWGLKRLNQFLCRNANGVAAMNAEALNEASRYGASLSRVMGTPLNYDFLTTPVQPLGMSVEKVLFVGRLAQEKGIPRILDAAKALPHTQFSIAGDGPMKAQVESVACEQDNLHYLGWLDRSRVLKAVDAHQALILPSHFETFGTVALEALARRRFVMVTPQCGIATWPSFADGLFHCDPKLPLADSIRRLQAMPHSERIQVAERSWNAVQDFNDHTIHHWLDFLCDVAVTSPHTQTQGQ